MKKLRASSCSGCPGEDSNLDSKSLRNQSLGAVGLFELPENLPRRSQCWRDTCWESVVRFEVHRERSVALGTFEPRVVGRTIDDQREPQAAVKPDGARYIS